MLSGRVRLIPTHIAIGIDKVIRFGIITHKLAYLTGIV